MLSAHEFAALFVIHDATRLDDVDPADLESLVHHRLVVVPQAQSAFALPRLTEKGRSVVQAVVVSR